MSLRKPYHKEVLTAIIDHELGSRPNVQNEEELTEMVKKYKSLDTSVVPPYNELIKTVRQLQGDLRANDAFLRDAGLIMESESKRALIIGAAISICYKKQMVKL